MIFKRVLHLLSFGIGSLTHLEVELDGDCVHFAL